MKKPNPSLEEDYRLILLNADIAAQTRQGSKALTILSNLPPEDLPIHLQAGYYSIKGEAHFRIGEYEEAREALEKSLALHQLPEVAIASPLQIAQIRNILAGSYYQQNLHIKALEQHLLCLEAVLAGFITETRFQLKLFANLGNDCYCLGRLQQSLEYYTQAVRFAEEGEDDTDRAIAFWGMGLVLRQLEKFEEAKIQLEKALELYLKVEANYYVTQVRIPLGWVLISLGEYTRAEEVLQTSLEEAKAGHQNFDDQALANLNLAYLYYESEKLEEAEAYIDSALELANQGNNKQTLGLVLIQMAEIRLAKGTETAEVRALFLKGLDTLEQIDSLGYLRRAYKRYSDALKKMGRLEEAFELLTRAYSVKDKA